MINFYDFIEVSIDELNHDDFIRFSYKKEKQANYQTRVGNVNAFYEKDGARDGIYVDDLTADPEQYLEDDIKTRLFKNSRVGTIYKYQPQQKLAPTKTVTTEVPEGYEVLVKMRPISKGN